MKRLEQKKIKTWAFAIVFLLIIMGFGFPSIYHLARFYVNNELDYNEWTPSLGTKFETDIASTFFQKLRFVDLNGVMASLLGQPVMNGVIKLENGYLFTPSPSTSDETLQEYADATKKVDTYCKDRGTALVYVSPPFTSSKYDPQLPVGVGGQYGNDNIDRFLALIRSEGIDTIDLRETMCVDGIDQYDMMYKTDHHWTTEAGLYAYGILEDYIVGKTGCEVDTRIRDIDNYTVTTYPKWHLGARGQRTGKYYAGIDDFDLILPAFDTTLQNEAGVTGSMQELMINMEPLQHKDYTSQYTYDTVLQGCLGDFTNPDSKNDVKVMIITDSFGKAVNQYLAMGFHEVDFIYDGNVSEVTPEIIDQSDPDVLIMMYYPDFLEEGRSAFSFTGF